MSYVSRQTYEMHGAFDKLHAALHRTFKQNQIKITFSLSLLHQYSSQIWFSTLYRASRLLQMTFVLPFFVFYRVVRAADQAALETLLRCVYKYSGRSHFYVGGRFISRCACTTGSAYISGIFLRQLCHIHICHGRWCQKGVIGGTKCWCSPVCISRSPV